jgi:hypothetical protein
MLLDGYMGDGHMEDRPDVKLRTESINKITHVIKEHGVVVVDESDS